MQVEKAEVFYRWKARWSTMQVEKAEVLYRWKARWSKLQVEKRLKYYTGGTLDGVQQCR